MPYLLRRPDIPAVTVRRILVTLIALLWLTAIPVGLRAAPPADPNDVQTAWRLLDYMAVGSCGGGGGGGGKTSAW